MPTYVYKCDKCDYKFEKKQKITADPLEECPKCKGKVKRLIFGNGVIFKSDGFYTTDYKRKDSNASKKAGKKEK
ncbi:MAG: zinc ribbon domain-containing protein [Candidatus Mcinerneyibacterium aminivorans]|uniref:Zinc ribbon domain-containing protein n=1 Tax=Candidatus Mcinerneyibacterium aminivorans TaxID=2703815 RepID=A0A5D0MBX7_9BACT|nr:MAG: zinc ribbon domain-containing protein [Candidatus Mcinerneyibacterium aminivorans]